MSGTGLAYQQVSTRFVTSDPTTIHSEDNQRRQWHPTPVTLAWKIPWMEEPGRLQSMGSLRVGHD